MNEPMILHELRMMQEKLMSQCLTALYLDHFENVNSNLDKITHVHPPVSKLEVTERLTELKIFRHGTCEDSRQVQNSQSSGGEDKSNRRHFNMGGFQNFGQVVGGPQN